MQQEWQDDTNRADGEALPNKKAKPMPQQPPARADSDSDCVIISDDETEAAERLRPAKGPASAQQKRPGDAAAARPTSQHANGSPAAPVRWVRK